MCCIKLTIIHSQEPFCGHHSDEEKKKTKLTFLDMADDDNVSTLVRFCLGRKYHAIVPCCYSY